MRATNLVLYLSFCAMTGTGALLTWKLVPGSEGGRGLTVLGWDRHEWGDFHFWIGALFVAAVLAHLILNWRWLTKIAARARTWRLAAGLGLGAVIVFGLLCLPVKREAGDPDHPGRGGGKVERGVP